MSQADPGDGLVTPDGIVGAHSPALDASSSAYEPPRLQQLGTLTELTRGAVPTTTDGILPGSSL